MSMIAVKSQTSTSTTNRPQWNAHKTNAKYQVRNNNPQLTNRIPAIGARLSSCVILFLNSHSCWLRRARRKRIPDFSSVVANVSGVARNFCWKSNSTARGLPARIPGIIIFASHSYNYSFDRWLLFLTPFPRRACYCCCCWLNCPGCGNGVKAALSSRVIDCGLTDVDSVCVCVRMKEPGRDGRYNILPVFTRQRNRRTARKVLRGPPGRRRQPLL